MPERGGREDAPGESTPFHLMAPALVHTIWVTNPGRPFPLPKLESDTAPLLLDYTQDLVLQVLPYTHRHQMDDSCETLLHITGARSSKDNKGICVAKTHARDFLQKIATRILHNAKCVYPKILDTYILGDSYSVLDSPDLPHRKLQNWHFSSREARSASHAAVYLSEGFGSLSGSPHNFAHACLPKTCVLQ